MKGTQSVICLKCPKCGQNYPADSTAELCRIDAAPLQAVYSDPWLGATLANRYNISEFAGSGGWAVVYRAEQISLNRQVAVKILERRLQSNPDLVKRFEQESRALSVLQHPNIVSIIDFGVVPSPYIVMEWLDGMDLSQILASGKELSLENKIQIFKQLAEALQHAHQANIIHRDLKPSNVKVLYSGENELKVKVLDFGLAKLVESSDNSVTRTGECFGSPPYMSPEQCQGRTVGPESDIYSLGLIIYELLTGKAAYAKKTIEEYFMAHSNEKVSSIYSKGNLLESALEQIVLKCLEKQPENRYKDAAELLLDLESVAQGRNLDKFLASRKTRGVSKALLFALLLLPIGAFLLFLLNKNPDKRETQRLNVSSAATARKDIKAELNSVKAIIGESSLRKMKNDSPPPPDKALKFADKQQAVLPGRPELNVAGRHAQLPTEAQINSAIAAIGIKEKPKSPQNEPEKVASAPSFADYSWLDETRHREVKVRIYKAAASGSQKPFLVMASESSRTAEYLLKTWQQSPYYLMTYDINQVKSPENRSREEILKMQRERSRDIVFAVENVKRMISEGDAMVDTANGGFYFVGERSSAPAIYAACGFKPENKFWNDVNAISSGVRGLILISPNLFGSDRFENYKRITAPVFVLSFADDLETSRWDPEYMASPAFSQSLSRKKCQVFFPALSLEQFIEGASTENTRAAVNRLSELFIRSCMGNPDAQNFLCSRKPKQLLGDQADYSYRFGALSNE
ncbi:MAG: serine/threonine protein kinase [Candidatus Obscuribacterales bacterium]|nr:serine/threonine protein kinase [Candidatus Obscuribacterales bacterium]